MWWTTGNCYVIVPRTCQQFSCCFGNEPSPEIAAGKDRITSKTDRRNKVAELQNRDELKAAEWTE